MADPRIPEDRRFCAGCKRAVGRTRGDVPGLTEGFCGKCGHPFSFSAKLRRGELVAGQYDVAGPIDHGGLGWIYLARDRRVADRWVALKGLINRGDAVAMGAALAERRSLAEVEHPNIVKIHNFVEHDGDGYIVMEYVNGLSLSKVLDARREDNDNQPRPLPVELAIEYILEVLPAVGHLHDLGLLYCDFKYSAPAGNKERNDQVNPCTKTGVCIDCRGAVRGCRVTVIIEYKPRRIQDYYLFIVGEDLGF